MSGYFHVSVRRCMWKVAWFKAWTEIFPRGTLLLLWWADRSTGNWGHLDSLLDWQWADVFSACSLLSGSTNRYQHPTVPVTPWANASSFPSPLALPWDEELWHCWAQDCWGWDAPPTGTEATLWDLLRSQNLMAYFQLQDRISITSLLSVSGQSTLKFPGPTGES